jgi:hypothetical protein
MATQTADPLLTIEVLHCLQQIGGRGRRLLSGRTEIVTLRQGDTVADVKTSDVLTQFDPELRDKLVQAVAGRMSDSAI